MRKTLLITAALFTSVFLIGTLYFTVFKDKQAVATLQVNVPDNTPVTPEIQKTAYITIVNSCGPYFEGTCTDVHSEPRADSPVIAQVRNGIVLQIAKGVTDATGATWYKIAFQGVRYPERITGDWYIRSDSTELVYNIGDVEVSSTTPKQETKHIVINTTTQMLYAYDGETLFMQTPVSTGFEITPTILGTFSVLTKTPSRYMQGPQPGITGYYDLPGVPWVMYFTRYGAAIHGAYWHSDFGNTQSHGCINLPPDQARKLYEWADLGTTVVIEN